MHFMNPDETRQFVRTHCDLDPQVLERFAPPSERAVEECVIEFDGTFSTFLPTCRNSLRIPDVGGFRLLWIVSQGNWRSQENLHAFHQLRLSYGETAPNFVKPGHYFHEFESNDLLSYFEMCVRYGWDAVVVHHRLVPILYLRNSKVTIFRVPKDS